MQMSEVRLRFNLSLFDQALRGRLLEPGRAHREGTYRVSIARGDR